MDFYDLSAKSANGTDIHFSDFIGKVVLVVNTATKCGLTPQFEGLEKLYKKYKDDGLVIIGFPCNQFANQEPESNETMVQTCSLMYDVSFPLTQKIDVNGKNTHPVYVFLKAKLKGFLGSRIKWNFSKFLIDSNGTPIKRYSPQTKPEALEVDIKRLLAAIKK
jgi:glutathione peroxidase